MDTPARMLVPGIALPDGPVELWVAVYAGEGLLMGAAPMTEPLAWLWRGGQLCLAYGPVRVIMRQPGTYSYGMICAVTAGEQAAPFAPLWRIGLGKPQEMRPGDDVHILDGVIALIPLSPAAQRAPDAREKAGPPREGGGPACLLLLVLAYAAGGTGVTGAAAGSAAAAAAAEPALGTW